MVFDYAIYNNSIYVCLASLLLENLSQDADDETLIKIYFQFLYSKNIINKRDFVAQKIELLKNKILLKPTITETERPRNSRKNYNEPNGIPQHNCFVSLSKIF